MIPFSVVGGVLSEVIDSYNVVSRVLKKKKNKTKPCGFLCKYKGRWCFALWVSLYLKNLGAQIGRR